MSLPLALLAKDGDIQQPPVQLTETRSCFVENNGQITDIHYKQRKDIDYKMSGGGLNLFVGNGALHYQWHHTPSLKKASGTNGMLQRLDNLQKTETQIYRLDVVLVGADKNAQVIAEEKQQYYENYYLAHCKQGITAHTYNKITYKNIYPNIDWILYANASGDGFKYDFVVHPGGRSTDIKLKYEGAASLEAVDGNVVAGTPLGNVTEHAPYSYEEKGRHKVPSSFNLEGNVLSFNIAPYEGTLVIDPLLNWSTYYGNPTYADGTTTSADTSGSSYLCGSTSSSSNIATLSAHQTVYGGAFGDGFIVKFANDGSREWATYYGGTEYESILSSTIDRNNRLCVVGFTSSPDGISSSSSVHQPANGGNIFSFNSPFDAFLAKFSVTGSLIWSTYYGGLKSEVGNAITCDNGNNIIIGGTTSSADNIASTTGAHQTTPSDGFIAKFTSGGTRLWGTYYNAEIQALACYRDTLYAGAITSRTTGVSATPSHQASFGGGAYDAVLAQFTGSGSRVWATYLGGTGYETIKDVICDSLHNIYVAGGSTSATGITSSGSFKPAHSDGSTPGSEDGYIAKFNKLCVRQWGTYYGDAAAIDNFYSLYLGPDNKIYASGLTGSLNNIATPGNYQTTNAGMPPPMPAPAAKLESDAFMVKFTQDGSRLWGTYFGGNKKEMYTDVAYSKGRIYLAGSTRSHMGITVNGFQSMMIDTNAQVAYLAQFQADTSVYLKYPFADSMLCAGGTVTMRYGVTNPFVSGNIFTVQLSDASGSFASTVNIGSLTATSEGNILCTIPPATVAGTGYKLRIVSSNKTDTFYNYDIRIRISRYHVPIAVSSISPVCINSPFTVYDANASSTVNYTWTGPNSTTYPFASWPVGPATPALSGDYIVETENFGCKARDTVNIQVLLPPADPVITGDTSLCIGDTLRLTATTTSPGVNYIWQGPAFQVQTTQDYLGTNVQLDDSGIYKVTVQFPLGCASATVPQKVTVHRLPSPTATNNTPICAGESIKLSASDTTAGGVTYTWKGPGFTSKSKDTTIANAQAGQDGIYIVTTTTIHGCSQDASTTVRVKPLPAQIEASNTSPVCTGTDVQLIAGNATENATYTWSGPNGYTSTIQEPLLAGATVAAQGIYKVVVDLEGCKREDTTLVTVYFVPDTPILSSNSPVKTGGVLKLQILNPQPGVKYTWSGPNQFSSGFLNPVLNSVTPIMTGIYKVTASQGTCTTSDTIVVVISELGKGKDKAIAFFPNPNNGAFRMITETETDTEVPIMIYASDGKLLFEDVAKPVKGKLDHKIDVTGRFANGVYRIKMRIDGKITAMSFTIAQ